MQESSSSVSYLESPISAFQRRIRPKEELYTAEDIREAMLTCFSQYGTHPFSGLDYVEIVNGASKKTTLSDIEKKMSNISRKDILSRKDMLDELIPEPETLDEFAEVWIVEKYGAYEGTYEGAYETREYHINGMPETVLIPRHKRYFVQYHFCEHG